MKRTTITLPNELSALLTEEARRRQSSVSGVVRELVTEGLTGSPRRPREIPFAGLFEDPDMAPARDLDETLASSWADDIDRDRR